MRSPACLASFPWNELRAAAISTRAEGCAVARIATAVASKLFMSAATLIDHQRVRDQFEQWQVGQLSIDAELNESLAALSAFQSHLEAWQQELAREREELRAARERMGHDQANAEQGQARTAELTAELTASRDKVGALTTMLLSRTEELRVLDNRRAEMTTELELSRAREKELKIALDDIKQSRESERQQSAEETRHLRELLQRRLENMDASYREEVAGVTRNNPKAPESPDTQAVFSSVMEQFGKLRQQRAQAGNALKKGR
jgi:chromosome segregation ATPase